MLIEEYSLTIVNNHCLPGAESVNAIARLKGDVADVIPYLNSALGGSQCTQDPPSVTFKTEGKLIAVQPGMITVNGVKDEAHARKIFDWMVREINDTWNNRDTITPHYKQAERPSMTSILALLPKTNCRKCGEPTCMVFAIRLAEGAKDVQACPELSKDSLENLSAYMSRYQFD